MSRIEKFIKNSWLMFDRKIILPYNIFTKTARKGGQGSPPGKNHWLKLRRGTTAALLAAWVNILFREIIA